MNLIPTCQKPVALALVLLLSANLRAVTAAWSDGTEMAVTAVTVNSRTVRCDPPGRYNGKTVYLPASFISRHLGIAVKRTSTAATYSLSAYADVLHVVVGVASCQLNEEIIDTAAPQERERELLVPIELLTRGFKIGAEIDKSADNAPVVKLTLPGGNVEDIRLGRHPDKARVVLDLDQPAGYSWSVEGNTITVDVGTPPAEPGQVGGLRLMSFAGPVVQRIAQSPTSDGFTRVAIACRECELLQVFTLPDPARIVVDLAMPSEPSPIVQPPVVVKPGAGRWQTRNFKTPRGPLSVYVLTVNPAEDGLVVRPALAGETVRSRRSVLRIARENNAIAALNGGFFARQGPPLGWLVIDGEWIKHPILHRTALGITADGKLLMDRLSFDGRLYFENHGYLELDAINRGQDESYPLVVYTPRWGEVVEAAADCTRLVVTKDAKVAAKETAGRPIEISAHGYVISGCGRYAELLNRVEVGETVRMRLRTTPLWNDVVHAIGAGPRVVKNGRPHVTASPEIFRDDVTWGVTSRAAVAITNDEELMLVAVETPPGASGKGVSLAELAQILVKLGARDAMNLDGGGSVTVVQYGQVLNSPRDGAMRAVSNALVVVPIEVEVAGAE